MESLLALAKDSGWAIAVAVILGREIIDILKGDRRKLLASVESLSLEVARIGVHIDYLRDNRRGMGPSQESIPVSGPKVNQ